MGSHLSTLQAVYEAFSKGDVPAVLDKFHPEIEWREPESLPYGDQVGPAAVAQNVFSRVVQDISGFTIAIDEFVDGGDTIVTLGTYRGTGARTGIPLNTPFVHVWKFRDGKLSYFRTYTDTKQWVDTLGV